MNSNATNGTMGVEMGRALRSCLALVVASTAAAASAGQEAGRPHYRLEARVEPAARRIEVEACVDGAPGQRFSLYKEARIRRVTAGGRPMAFRWDRDAKASFYAPQSGVVVLESPPAETVCVEYEGTYPGTVNGVNMISPGLVELALYAGWYPRFEGAAPFTFDLQADLPPDFVVVTNGAMKTDRLADGRRRTRWEGASATDIVLVASPGLQRLEGSHEGARVELYFTSLPPEATRRFRDELVAGLARYTRWYGRPAAPGLLRIVYSPRPGWGYSRAPLFLMSEAYATGQLQAEMGEAQVLHGSFHEMAHFWWNLAGGRPGDDWVNEGLAEFSALRLSREVSGEAFGARLVAEYREHAGKSAEEVAIAETPDASADRYVNRYEKTTLLLDSLSRQCGQEKLDDLLTRVQAAHAGRNDLTTAMLLGHVEERLGQAARAFVERALFAKRWSEDLLSPSSVSAE